MKRILAVILIALLALCAACSADTSQSTENIAVSTSAQSAENATQEAAQASQTEQPPEVTQVDSPAESASAETPSAEGADTAQADSQQATSNILVAYFTYAQNADLPTDVDTSTSASIDVANGEVTGNTGLIADMIAQDTGADTFPILTVEKYPASYDETVALAQTEENDNARPELATQLANADVYDIIFLGYPNWWGNMPMAVYTFLETNDFAGKTIIPFVTHGGSGFSGTIQSIQDAQPDAMVEQNGLSIRDSNVPDAQQTIQDWLAELHIIEN